MASTERVPMTQRAVGGWYPLASGHVGRAVIPVEETWSVKSELPYFDTRLVVDTCAQLVSSSFQFFESSTNRERGGPSGSKAGSGTRRDVALLQVMISYAHSFAGAERFVFELVPRCRPLKEQLKQTVYPLCAGSKPLTQLGGMKELIDHEVERFLRARLVVCDLSELMVHNVIGDEGQGPIDDALPKLPWAFSKTELPDEDDTKSITAASASATASIVGRRAEQQKVPPNVLSLEEAPEVPITSERDRLYDFEMDNEAEVWVQRFELRFWRLFAHGLGRSLFGNRDDLVARFELAAQELFERYQGEVQLATNSLMGWLPSYISNSLFIAFVGLPATTATRQASQKFLMLHRCMRTLIHSSGRYLFISTPSWYLPVVSWLPRLDRKERVRAGSAQFRLSLRSLWPSAVLDPPECVAAVDAVWGGRIPGKRAQLALYAGVEAMGPFVLRMTLGCEELFSQALTSLRKLVPLFEAAYDELMEKCQLEMEPTYYKMEAKDLRRLAANNALLIIRRGLSRRRTAARRQVSREPLPRQEDASSLGGCKSNSQTPKDASLRSALRRTPTARPAIRPMPFKHRDVLPPQGFELTWYWKFGESAQGEEQQERPEEPKKEKTAEISEETSLLAQLHADTHGLCIIADADMGNCRVRRSMATSAGQPGEINWPLGHPDTLGGRIPIHDSPELLPTAPPPIVESTWLGGPNFTVPDLPSSALLNGDKASTHEPESPQLKRLRRITRRITMGLDNAGTPQPEQTERPQRRRSAPSNLMIPRDWLQELASMSGRPDWKGSSEQADAARARRPNSAPAAVDCSDFDAGNPMKNTSVALALQAEVRSDLCCAIRSESPLHLAWRRANSAQDMVQVHRLRLVLCTLLLFAVTRAPLPVLEELSLHHFMSLQAEVVQERNMLPQPKVTIPDAIYIMGCLPVFHTPATELSARMAPLMSGACHVGVPYAMLEDRVLRDALYERKIGHPPCWSPGSMLVLLVAGAILEGHLVSQSWASPTGWLRQDHLAFFPLTCIFRFMLGLEHFVMWRQQLQWYPRRSQVQARDAVLSDLLTFLKDVDTEIASLPLELDLSTATPGSVGAATAAPLLIAPWVVPSKFGSPRFDPRTAVWGPEHRVGSEGLSLQDFAAWVCCLPPGRVVYSSHRSKAADLYLRLDGAVIAIVFYMGLAGAPLTGYDALQLVTNVIGERIWWQDVSLVSCIVLPSRLSGGLDLALSAVNTKAFRDGAVVDGCGSVPKGIELILCAPQCLWALLGPTKTSVVAHASMFAEDMREEAQPPKRQKLRPELSLRFAGVPAGAARNAVADWRSKRPPAPRQEQLKLNADVLRALLDHVNSHGRQLADAVQDLCSEDELALGSDLSSTPAPSSPKDSESSHTCSAEPREVLLQSPWPRSPPLSGHGIRPVTPASRAVSTASRAVSTVSRRQSGEGHRQSKLSRRGSLSRSDLGTMTPHRHRTSEPNIGSLLGLGDVRIPSAGSDGSHDLDGVHFGPTAKVDRRARSPARTDLRLYWRPSTPHPAHPRPLTADERDGATRNFANAWDANRQISEDGQLFDFMDLGIMCLPQTTTQEKKVEARPTRASPWQQK